MSKAPITGVTPMTTVAELLAAQAAAKATTTVKATTTARPTTTTGKPTTTIAGVTLSLVGDGNVQYYKPERQLVFGNGPMGKQNITQEEANKYVGGQVLQNGVSLGNITMISARGANPNNHPGLYIEFDKDPGFNPTVPYVLVKPTAGGRRRSKHKMSRKKMSKKKMSRRR